MSKFNLHSVSRGALLTLAILVLAGLGSRVCFAQGDQEDENDNAAARTGAVFAMTNRTPGNEIVEYARAANGVLTRVGAISTRGRGIGTDLDAQHPLILSRDHRYLYAVNAGSDDISVFGVDGTNLVFLQKVYAGDDPVSLTLHDDLLYVLDNSVAGNQITGFSVSYEGTLTPIPNSARPLSSAIAVPGDVEFNPDGRVILVTHKTTDLEVPPFSIIDAFTVASDGTPSATPILNASHGLRPFSLAFRSDGKLVVAESFNARPGLAAASSYDLAPDGTIEIISGSVHNYQQDSCWVVISNDGRYAYTANFGSGTIASFALSTNGDLSLLQGKAAFFGATSQPVDLALSKRGRFLYLLLRGLGAVAAFHIENNGGLAPLGMTTGALPVNDGASGLAAY